MSPRFVALPVPKGDAFLFEGDNTFLIDAGANKQRVLQLFRKHAHAPDIDVLVCTHNDSDHAQGVPGLLGQSWPRVGEIWLPAEFKESLEESLKLGVAGTVKLLEDITDGTPIDAAADDDVARRDDSAAKDPSADRKPAAEPVTAALGAHAERLRERIVAKVGVGMLRRPFGASVAESASAGLTLSRATALRAMANIADIAKAAFKHNVPVVWLRHVDHQVRGVPYSRHGLTVINAVRVARSRPQPLLRLVALTLQNRRALVLRARVDDVHDVLFCSDSRLEFQTRAFTGVSVFTAPHHGSPSNDVAYQWLPTTTSIAVRSDRQVAAGNATPTTKYSPGCSTRACTRCRASTRSDQAVEATFAGGAWTLSKTTLRCTCK